MTASDDELYGEIEYEPELVILGPVELQVLTISYMPLPLLMKKTQENVENSGQAVWTGSLGLISYFFQHHETTFHDKVENEEWILIELGAGTGALAMAMAKMLPQVVSAIVTDHDPISLRHMKEDITRNSLDHLMSCVRLDWYEPHENMNEVIEEALRHAKMNGKEGATRRLMIIAGDVLYKSVLMKPFFATAKLCWESFQPYMTTVDSSMWLCHVPRAGVSQEIVQDGAISGGFTPNMLEKSSWRDFEPVMHAAPAFDADRAAVYRLELNK